MEHEWRCTHCGRLLGVLGGNRLHIRFARGHEYIVGFPATSVCRGCRSLNELPVQQDGCSGTTQPSKRIGG
jgi:phage FluMu protein Com